MSSIRACTQVRVDESLCAYYKCLLSCLPPVLSTAASDPVILCIAVLRLESQFTVARR
jgi:hypothetical protein